jgi:hypothetical protein
LKGDRLSVRSILTNTIVADYPECYTFQVARITHY